MPCRIARLNYTIFHGLVLVFRTAIPCTVFLHYLLRHISAFVSSDFDLSLCWYYIGLDMVAKSFALRTWKNPTLLPAKLLNTIRFIY